MAEYNIYVGSPTNIILWAGRESGSSAQQAIRKAIKAGKINAKMEKYPHSLDGWPQSLEGPKSGDAYTTGLRVDVFAVPVNYITHAKVGILGPHPERGEIVEAE